MKTSLTFITCGFLIANFFSAHNKIGKPVTEIKVPVLSQKQIHCSASNSTSFGQVMSEEETSQSGTMSISIKLIARDTTSIDSLQIESPELFSFTINGVLANKFSGSGSYNSIYLLPDAYSSCNISVSYNASNLPYYPKEIKFKTYTHNTYGEVALSIADAMIYFTPYSTTEIWDRIDFDKLPRVWIAEQNPEPE